MTIMSQKEPSNGHALPLKMIPPFKLDQWIQDNKHLLQPPVNNYCLWRSADFTVMAVGGPNKRTDYHINPTEVFQRDLYDRNSFINTRVKCCSRLSKEMNSRMLLLERDVSFYYQVDLSDFYLFG